MDGPWRKRHPLDLCEESLEGRGDAGRALGGTRAVGKPWPRGGAGPDASLLLRQPLEAQNP